MCRVVCNLQFIVSRAHGRGPVAVADRRNAGRWFNDVLPDGRALIVQQELLPKVFKPRVVIFQSMETVGMVMSFQGQALQFLGHISDGAITFEQANNQPESPVVGSFQGRLLQIGCLNLIRRHAF